MPFPYGAGSFWADAFLTFRNVAIPKNVTINKAFVRFTAKSGTGNLFTVNNTDDTVEAMIFGNDVDDSDPPTDLSSYTDKVLTSACKNWSAIADWTDETTYDTPDISCIIQEIIDRNGWASGNDISIYVQNNYGTSTGNQDIGRRAYDYGTTPAKAPQLFVYYTMDEVMSGGVRCGGSAIAGRILSPTIAAAGVLCGGTAVVGRILAPTINPNGVVCSGTATVSGGSSLYNEVGSGGVVVSGDVST